MKRAELSDHDKQSLMSLVTSIELYILTRIENEADSDHHRIIALKTLIGGLLERLTLGGRSVEDVIGEFRDAMIAARNRVQDA